MSFRFNENYTVNFGPQHPSAHGVLRLILNVNGERVLMTDPHIGLLHRGTEKLMETKNYFQNIPYMDRFDYVSMLINEHVYALAIESLYNLNVPLRAQYIRVLLSEITRLLNHIMALTTHAMDVGALTPFLWAFEEREKLFEIYETISGARMHAAYIKPGGVSFDLPAQFLSSIFLFVQQFSTRVDELEELLTTNRIWYQRLKNVGVISLRNAKMLGFSGVLLRGSGLKQDLRLITPYEIYHRIKFNSYVGFNGDCFDRYLIRIYEMRQSTKIIQHVLNFIPYGNIRSELSVNLLLSRSGLKNKMEELITHFKTQLNELKTQITTNKQIYMAVESPKGEFGIFLNVFNAQGFRRCKLRAPGFWHLSGLACMAKDHLIADVVTIIGTQDIVFGEVDR